MKRHLATAAGLLLLVNACGKTDDGYVYKEEPVRIQAQPEKRAEFDLTESSYLSVTWIHQCADNPIQMPAQRNGHLVLEGNGPHDVVRARLLNTDVIFKGRLCAPRTYSRDVVIGVDISSPVFLNDQPVNNSCKRLEAVNNLLNSLPADTRFGLFAFEDDIQESSTSLVGTRAELEAQLLSNNTTMFNVVCDDKLADGVFSPGGVDFNKAMEKAKELLTTGRNNGTKKEFYMITSGHPSAPNEPTADAERIAREMATNGVSVQGESIKVSIAAAKIDIGTPRTPSILDKLVTNDINNQKLLKTIDQVVPLADEVAKFTINNWTQATLSHGDSQPNKIVDLVPLFTGDYDFEVPAFKLNLDATVTGHVVKIDIRDTHGNIKSEEVSFNWVD